MGGTNDAKKLTSTFTAPLSQPNTLLLLAQSNTSTPAHRYLTDGPPGGTGRHAVAHHDDDGGGGLFAGGTQIYDPLSADTNPHIVVATFDGADSQLLVNGQPLLYGNPGSNTMAVLTLGNRHADADSSHWRGAYGLVLIYHGEAPTAALGCMTRLLRMLTSIPAPAAPTINAARGIVLDGDGEVVYAKDADTLTHVASVTQVMAAYAVRQWAPDADLTDTLTLQSSDIVARDIGVAAGDVLTFGELLRGALIPSSNSCAVAMARAVGERILAAESASGDPAERFMEEMGLRLRRAA